MELHLQWSLAHKIAGPKKSDEDHNFVHYVHHRSKVDVPSCSVAFFYEPSQEIVRCSDSDPDQLITVHHYRQRNRYISNIRLLHFSDTGYGHL